MSEKSFQEMGNERFYGKEQKIRLVSVKWYRSRKRVNSSESGNKGHKSYDINNVVLSENLG